MLITRFAPSPTGYLHFGNIRAALFNWLAAKNGGGKMRLRIEDTDAARDEERYVAAIQEDLAWLGMDWEGDMQRQSERRGEHERLFLSLRRGGRVYPCFCSPEQLAEQRRRQLAAGKPPKYAGVCARLSGADAAARLDGGEAAAWRFRMHSADGGAIRFDDIVRGEALFNADAIGDFVIRRANGEFAFLFVNIVDDMLCGITHVLRGDDHVSNTPRQLAMAAALEMTPPRYGHIPLLVNNDDKPLSKRDGLAPARDWRKRGFLPAAALNYLARVGHVYPSAVGEELLSAEDLAKHFSLRRLSRAAARYDEAQLRHRQKQAARALGDEEFCRWVGDSRLAGVADKAAFCRLVRDNVSLPDDAMIWRKALSDGESGYDKQAQAIIAKGLPNLLLPELYGEAAKAAGAPDWEAFRRQLRQRFGDKHKGAMPPLRAALTGRGDGPALAAIYAYMSPKQREERFSRAADHCQTG